MLRISRSVLAAARGSIGERDDLIPSQESARGREAATRAAQKEQRPCNSYTAQRVSAATQAQKGQHIGNKRPSGLMQGQLGQLKDCVT